MMYRSWHNCTSANDTGLLDTIKRLKAIGYIIARKNKRPNTGGKLNTWVEWDKKDRYLCLLIPSLQSATQVYRLF